MIVLRFDLEKQDPEILNNWIDRLNDYFSDEQFLLIPKDMDISAVSEKYNYEVKPIQEEVFNLIKSLKEKEISNEI